MLYSSNVYIKIIIEKEKINLYDNLKLGKYT